MALGTQEPHPLPVQVSKEHQQQRLHLQILPQVTPRFSQPLMEKLHSSHLALAVSRPWSAATRARSSGDLAPAMQKKFLLYMLLLRIRKALITIFGGFPLNSQVNLLSKVIPPAPHKRGSQHLPNCRGPPRFVPPDVFQVIFVACSATVKPSCFWCNRIQQISSPRTRMKRDVRSSLIVPSSWHLTDGRKSRFDDGNWGQKSTNSSREKPFCTFYPMGFSAHAPGGCTLLTPCVSECVAFIHVEMAAYQRFVELDTIWHGLTKSSGNASHKYPKPILKRMLNIHHRCWLMYTYVFTCMCMHVYIHIYMCWFACIIY